MRRRQGGDTAYLVSACEGGMCTHLHARRKSTPAFRETTQGSMSLCRVSSHGQLQHISHVHTSQRYSPPREHCV